MARTDLEVPTADGVRLFVRVIEPLPPRPGLEPLVMVHGARVAGLGSFDLPVAGASLAADLARCTGRAVYVMDARGYGASARPPAMEEPPEQSRPLSRAVEVVRDVAAVSRAAAEREHTPQVSVLGWATGGMWGAFYASLEPERVGQLVLINALYTGEEPTALFAPGGPVADPSSLGGYGIYDASSVLGPWDRAIPVADKASWRDPTVAEAYQREALASDPTSASRTPPSFRAPLGALEDSFYQANGRQLFDAGSIRASVLLVRGELDSWTRAEDIERFVHDAVHAHVETLRIPGATHFVHLDRPEHGRSLLLERVCSFLGVE